MSAMNTFASQAADVLDAPRLRLMPASSAARGATGAGQERRARRARPMLRLLSGPAPAPQPVLVAGGDSAGRAAVLRDLSVTMAPDTVFAEADAFWEVLVRAPSSSMVILNGELDDVPAESLMQMLAHRHPSLPVVSIDGPASPEDVESSSGKSRTHG
jgi:hypothetical protein